MSTHVLLNLLNDLGKRDKMRGLLNILSLFRNEFNKFNDTRALMLDSIYTEALKGHRQHDNYLQCRLKILAKIRNLCSSCDKYVNMTSTF